MKLNLLVIAFFSLALALQTNDSYAFQLGYRLDSLDNPRILLAKKRIQAASPSLSSKTEHVNVQSNLSQSEMKLIDDASAMAFKELKKFYMIASRSRFG